MLKHTGFQDIEQDWVVTPGEIIRERQEAYGWTQEDLAGRLGVSTKHLNQVLSANARVSEDLAEKLAYVFKTSSTFWLNLEQSYQQDLRRQARREELERTAKAWSKRLPCRELRKRGIIEETLRNPVDLAIELLQFFRVSSIAAYEAQYAAKRTDGSYAFRTSQKTLANRDAISTWLREGESEIERQNEELQTIEYVPSNLETAIEDLKAKTCMEPTVFEETVKRTLAEVGVGFAIIPKYPRAAVSGAARFLNQNRPYILLSDYGKSMDKMWFNLFHELGHILLHFRELTTRKNHTFLDDLTVASKDDRESEADAFARDTLIPPEIAPSLSALRSEQDVRNFADRHQIHPGIVVGRMQHDGLLKYPQLNGLKQRYS